MNNEKLKNKLFEALDEGLLTWEQVAIACVDYMRTDDVAGMIRANEFINEEEDEDIDNDNEVLKRNIASYMIKVGLHYANIENHNWTVDCDDIMRKFDLSHDTIIELLKQIATDGIIEEIGCDCVADIEYSDYDCEGININFYMDYIPREYIDIDKIEINHEYCTENEENEEEK